MQVALNSPQLVKPAGRCRYIPGGLSRRPIMPLLLDALSALAGLQVASRRAADEITRPACVADPMTRAFLLKNLARKADGQFGLKAQYGFNI